MLFEKKMPPLRLLFQPEIPPLELLWWTENTAFITAFWTENAALRASAAWGISLPPPPPPSLRHWSWFVLLCICSCIHTQNKCCCRQMSMSVHPIRVLEDQRVWMESTPSHAYVNLLAPAKQVYYSMRQVQRISFNPLMTKVFLQFQPKSRVLSKGRRSLMG